MRLIPMTCATFALALAGCSASSSPSKPAPAPPRAATPPKADTTAVAEAPAPKPGPADKDAKIKAERDKLSPEDRALVEAQEWCVQSDERLGEMGPPIKIMIKDKPVFLCCDSCEKDAKADPDKTLAKVEELKKKKAEQKK
jgi:hypothetical protein